jgi:triacylglycerol lipase
VKTPNVPFLLPPGFHAPGRAAVLRELSSLPEVGRASLRRATSSVACGRREDGPGEDSGRGTGEPVLLIPGFLAGDPSLAMMSRRLRHQGFRTYRSSIIANISCTWRTSRLLETRLESIVDRRAAKVRIVGHSLGGMLARCLAVRRPDLVSGIVTLGSPVLAPAAHHSVLGAHLELLQLLSRYGVPQVLTPDCVRGDCARDSFEEMRSPLPAGVGFTALYSRRDGIVDWRACLDTEAEHLEVPSSHIGMAFDPRTHDVVVAALLAQAGMSALALGDVG